MATISPINVPGTGNERAAAASQLSSTTAAKTASASVQPSTTLKADTVKLSLAANVILMHHQGISPSTIAAQLGISVKEVNGYIPGASVTTSPSSTDAAYSSGKPTQAAALAAPTESTSEQNAAVRPQAPVASSAKDR